MIMKADFDDFGEDDGLRLPLPDPATVGTGHTIRLQGSQTNHKQPKLRIDTPIDSSVARPIILQLAAAQQPSS